ncbi:MAG: SIS domain-containing protein, partial [Deltaproteobacteria bacterium]|nr:SIS domain-containing protein [Deltaproteobacteria bacterium]
SDRMNKRVGQEVLSNQGMHVQPIKNGRQVAVTVTYKIAAEIGRLGDNIRSLRQQIRSDSILQRLATLPHVYDTVMTHTRWASVGAITEANGCPIDNKSEGRFKDKKGWIHVCLNGDIDNYLELKTEYEKSGGIIHPDVTTDTKIIPLQIEKYVSQGHAVEEAFRMAVNDFQGSHAISMHTDLEPGKLFLAQKGSGQALFVGISDDHYMASSEVYGFVEETSKFIRMNGDQIIEGRNGKTQGQVFILDQESGGDLDGITAMYYDGTPIAFKADDIQETEITSRDIDRQNYPHYFFKEISEAPASVEKTLQNRWKISADPPHHHGIVLDERTIPHRLRSALAEGKIRRIFFIGQGTAGVAALACSNILNTYLNNPSILIGALKASELSGFNLGDPNDTKSMADTLIVAISQSGTTTDTNRTVEMVRERGAHTIAIVNRRDSDITFKVDGVLYTSSGRDIEMSVASTKAFYSQITAGAVLSLYIARLRNRIDDTFVTAEVKQLLQLPELMREILSKKELMEKSARRLAASKTYWAAVGSGPNKASADEIRIKLSELCYKTISSDFVEDKKHIDLSSEPLIIVCAAGSREAVLGDIIKDTAIFHAHKATPVVIANEGEDRFDPYAEDVFYIPVVAEHFAPILNTLVGHIWGYYAALSINEGSQLLYGFQNEIQQTIDAFVKEGLDVYEVILEKSFREKIVRFYEQFRKRKSAKHFSIAIAQAADIILLLKYLSGRLPVSDFELDFGKKGTALNMINSLFEYVGESINRMARPIDAIKHQAKTVTVGTSRISDRVEGILYDEFFDYQIKVSQLTPRNVIVLRNLQGVVSKINGSILYRINKLNLLGEPTEESTIELSDKRGKLKSLASRVETDNELKGTKRIIAREGNVYIGLGRKD